MASNGVYYYVLVLQGCGSSSAYTGVIHLLDGGRSYTSEIEQYSDREVFENYSKNDSLFQLLSDTTLLGVDKRVTFHSPENDSYISAGISDSSTGLIDIATDSFESYQEQIFNIYPNPSNNHFWVESNVNNYEIKVFNASGQIVYSQNSLAQLHKIDMSSQSNGVYLIQILSYSNLFTKYVIKI